MSTLPLPGKISADARGHNVSRFAKEGEFIREVPVQRLSTITGSPYGYF